MQILYPEYVRIQISHTGYIFAREGVDRGVSMHWLEWCLKHIPLRLYKAYIDMNGVAYLCSRISDMVLLGHPVDYIQQEYTRINKK